MVSLRGAGPAETPGSKARDAGGRGRARRRRLPCTRTPGGHGGDGPPAAMAVPVPAAAEVARLVDDEKSLVRLPLEPDCHLQTASAAEDEHVDVGDSRVRSAGSR